MHREDRWAPGLGCNLPYLRALIPSQGRSLVRSRAGRVPDNAHAPRGIPVQSGLYGRSKNRGAIALAEGQADLNLARSDRRFGPLHRKSLLELHAS